MADKKLKTELFYGEDSFNCHTHYFDPNKEKKPYKCPVCEGTGKVSRPPWIAGNIYQWVSTCQACSGSGVIWG